MILVVIAAVAALATIFALLPTWTPFDWTGAVADLASGAGAGVFEGLGWLNYYVPVSEMLKVLALQLTIWGTVRAVQFVIWLGQLFHVIGGGD